MVKAHTEQAFEAAIEDFLITAGGYEKGDRKEVLIDAREEDR